MRLLTQPSGAFPIALVYITIGTLIDIWTIVAMIYFPPESSWGKFLMWGCLISGAALLLIGLFLGQIGRAARNAELPPSEVTPEVASSEQKAAENPPPVVATTSAAPAPAAPQTTTGVQPTTNAPRPV